MNKEQTEQTGQTRKARAPRGQRTQRMVNFRCDLENYDWLRSQPNIGRAINDALAAARGD